MNAGTDANVFLQIYGKAGRTTIHQLDNRAKNDFEKGAISEFTVSVTLNAFETPVLCSSATRCVISL